MKNDAFQQLDRVIHERARLAIMSLLAASPELSFTQIRSALELTDGNLAVHMKILQQAGYLAVTKSYLNRKPLTTSCLTPLGQQAFARYIDLLEQIVQQNRR